MKGLLLLLAIAALLFLLWDGGQNYESAMGATPEETEQVRYILKVSFWVAIGAAILGYILAPDPRRGG